MPGVRRGLLLGAAAQFALLAGLDLTVGLNAAGWLAGLGYGAAVQVLLARGLAASGCATLGIANGITFARAVLVGGVAALVVGEAHIAATVALATTALVLDFADGWAARHLGTVTRLGARFDMEVDATLILLLSLLAAREVGWWVLAIGLARYTFGLATVAMAWLRASLPPSRWRKVVAAAQGATLTVAVSAALPTSAVGIALAAALTMLVQSFGGQLVALWRHRRAYAQPAAVGAMRSASCLAA